LGLSKVLDPSLEVHLKSGWPGWPPAADEVLVAVLAGCCCVVEDPRAVRRRRLPQEVEGLRLPEPMTRPSLGGEPSELDQPRLVRVQLQPELREALAEISEEPLGVLTILKARHIVVGLCRVRGYAEWVVGSPVVAGVRPGMLGIIR
jgi:hypothetical protein